MHQILLVLVCWFVLWVVYTFPTINSVKTSGVARSLVLARHLLYASRSHTFHVRLHDISGMNILLLAGHMPGQARPSLRHW